MCDTCTHRVWLRDCGIGAEVKRVWFLVNEFIVKFKWLCVGWANFLDLDDNQSLLSSPGRLRKFLAHKVNPNITFTSVLSVW